MNKKSLRKSRYLKQADCDPPVALTIEKVEDEDVEFQGKEPENCAVMYFKETDKVLILRPVHADAIADYCGTTNYMGDDESDKWIGHKLEFYREPSVTMGGKRVGGIRVRPVGPETKKAAAAVVDDDDAIDFGPPDDIVEPTPIKQQATRIKQRALKMEGPF